MSVTPHTPYSMLQCSVQNHRMTVLKDDGLYRHVRFAEPGTSIWHFDLVTWPGHLVITGDLQSYHFARISDMFEFFRTKRPGEINESYWGEKLKGTSKVKSYSAEQFKRHVYTYFREFCSWDDHPHAKLWAAIREELLNEAEQLDESEAYRRLNEFSFPLEEVIPATKYRDRVVRKAHFQFTDSWEWDLREWDWHFRLSLHAIVWGIQQWNTVEHKTEAYWLRHENRELRAQLTSMTEAKK